MSLEEAILEKVREMAPEQQEKLLRIADKLQHPTTVTSGAYWDGKKEMEWLRRNRDAYMNMGVSLDGDGLIAADPDGHKVYDAAKAQGIETPFVTHIVPEETHTSGWIERVE